MLHVFTAGTPLQVHNGVMAFVTVNVVNLWFVFGIRNECLCHNPMQRNALTLSEFPQVNGVIPRDLVDFWLDPLTLAFVVIAVRAS